MQLLPAVCTSTVSWHLVMLLLLQLAAIGGQRRAVLLLQ